MSNAEMVCTSVIAEIAQTKANVRIDTNTLSYGMSCYEAGMLEVLRGIALQIFDKGDPSIRMSKRVAIRNSEYLEKREALENSLNGKLKSLLDDLEEASNLLGAQENEDYFIEGFLRGYRYLKNHIEYHSCLKEDLS